MLLPFFIPLTSYLPGQVHLLVRGEKLRASKTMADRALTSPKIKVHFNTSVEDATGNGVLSGLNLVNSKTGEIAEAHSFERIGLISLFLPPTDTCACPDQLVLPCQSWIAAGRIGA